MIKILRTIILPVVSYGCETWSREENRLRVLKKKGIEEDIWTRGGGNNMRVENINKMIIQILFG
jgi:hypothetical protein